LADSFTQTCVNCNYENSMTDTYCARCGYVLPKTVTTNPFSTRLIGNDNQIPMDVRWGTGYFHRDAHLLLHLVQPPDTGQKLDLQFDPAMEVFSYILGRTTDTRDREHIDLTPLGGLELGISRRHIRLDRIRDSLYVTDLRSVNGTWLNGERLPPGSPAALRNRAILQLGKMAFRVEFS